MGTLKMASNDELACVYAALILMDDDVSITVEKINTILKAANVAVEPYWPGLFAKAAGGLDLKSIVANIGASVGSGGGGAAPAAAADAPAKEEEKKVESEAEESDEDMGFSLFVYNFQYIEYEVSHFMISREATIMILC